MGRRATRGRTAVILTAALTVGACGTPAQDEPPTAQPSDSSGPTGEPDDGGDGDGGIGQADEPPVALYGLALEAADEPTIGTPGFALADDVGVVLLNRNGTPLGHLAGWTVDLERSLHTSAPHLVDADGARAVIVDGRVVPLPEGGGLVLDGPPGVTISLLEDGVVVERNGAETARFDPADGWTDVRVAALRDRVTLLADDRSLSHEVAAGEEVELAPGCWVPDRHPDVSDLVLCDHQPAIATTLARGVDDPVLLAEHGLTWGTVGTTGLEAMAVGPDGCGGWAGWDLDLASGGGVAVDVDGRTAPPSIPLFYTAGGGRWVAATADGCGVAHPEPGIYEQDADGTWQRLGGVYPTLDAAVAWVL